MPVAPRLDPAALTARVRSRGFTPSVRDLPGLTALLEGADEDLATDVTRALVRIGAPLLAALAPRLGEAPAPARPHLCRVVGRLAGEDPRAALDLLLPRLEDSDARTRRAAATALGKIDLPEVEPALLAAWARETSLPERRALAASMGKVGKGDALAALGTVGAEDPELAKLAARSRLMIDRTKDRATTTTIDASVAAPFEVDLVFSCRGGFEAILADELGTAWRARTSSPGEVRGTLSGPLARAFEARIALDFAVALPAEPIAKGTLEDAVVRALTSKNARTLFAAWTRGPVRYRLAFGEGGHRRALVWRIASRVREAAPELVNDPTESPWEVRVVDKGSHVELLFVPTGLDDPRFTYRVRDVPAASHPTVAAALARLAGARPQDVVWDPFVGSGSELVERARLGPARELVGTDLDPRALEAARENLAAAKVVARVQRRDALEGFPALGGHTAGPEDAPTLVLTNPPLGHRLLRDGGAAALLERFVDVVARDLAPGGRLVWITSAPDRTGRRARAAGLVLRLDKDVDLAAPRRGKGHAAPGLRARLEVWEKPAARVAPSRRS